MRLNDHEYRELIAAAQAKRAATTDPKAKGHLTAAIRKLETSFERRRQNNNAASRRGSIRAPIPSSITSYPNSENDR